MVGEPGGATAKTAAFAGLACVAMIVLGHFAARLGVTRRLLVVGARAPVGTCTAVDTQPRRVAPIGCGCGQRCFAATRCSSCHAGMEVMAETPLVSGWTACRRPPCPT